MTARFVRFVRFVGFIGFIGCVGFAALSAAQGRGLLRGTMLDAHNCYPDNGQWANRLSRALATARRPVGIEQDLVWKADGRGGGVPVVGHETELTGAEPSLESHFFAAVAPLLDAALREGRRDTWPLVVLHFDFKTNEREHHRAVLALLRKYRRWLTTAPRGAGDAVQPMTPGPLLVLTEAGDGQERDFYRDLPAGEPLMIFGTVPPVTLTESDDKDVQWDAAVNAPPDRLLPAGATNYRRWANFSWSVIERGGPSRAGAWTAADAARLSAVVTRGHALGLWMRFYTLDGYTGAGQGWGESYNVGSLDAVRERWRALIAAGVEFLTTDQYEEAADALAPSVRLRDTSDRRRASGI